MTRCLSAEEREEREEAKVVAIRAVGRRAVAAREVVVVRVVVVRVVRVRVAVRGGCGKGGGGDYLSCDHLKLLCAHVRHPLHEIAHGRRCRLLHLDRPLCSNVVLLRGAMCAHSGAKMRCMASRNAASLEDLPKLQSCVASDK